MWDSAAPTIPKTKQKVSAMADEPVASELPATPARLPLSVGQVVETWLRVRDQPVQFLLSDQVRGFITHMASAIATAAASAARWIETSQQWDREEAELFAILVPRGWLLSPEVPMSFVSELLRIRRDQGLRALDHRLIKEYSPRFCSAIVRQTYNRPEFLPWRPTFERALRAHRHRDYALAIPIWLAAIDGILASDLATEDVYTKLRRKGVRKQLRAKMTPPEMPMDRMADAWVAVLAGMGVREGVNREIAVLNRHAILHGSRPRIGGERDSIQCILVLHLLHYFMESREEWSMSASNGTADA